MKEKAPNWVVKELFRSWTRPGPLMEARWLETVSQKIKKDPYGPRKAKRFAIVSEKKKTELTKGDKNFLARLRNKYGVKRNSAVSTTLTLLENFQNAPEKKLKKLGLKHGCLQKRAAKPKPGRRSLEEIRLDPIYFFFEEKAPFADCTLKAIRAYFDFDENRQLFLSFAGRFPQYSLSTTFFMYLRNFVQLQKRFVDYRKSLFEVYARESDELKKRFPKDHFKLFRSDFLQGSFDEIAPRLEKEYACGKNEAQGLALSIILARDVALVHWLSDWENVPGAILSKQICRAALAELLSAEQNTYGKHSEVFVLKHPGRFNRFLLEKA